MYGYVSLYISIYLYVSLYLEIPPDFHCTAAILVHLENHLPIWNLKETVERNQTIAIHLPNREGMEVRSSAGNVNNTVF